MPPLRSNSLPVGPVAAQSEKAPLADTSRRQEALESPVSRVPSAAVAVKGREVFPNRMRPDSLALRLLKKVQMQGGKGGEVRGVLNTYVAAPRERANAAEGSFSAAC